jgi:hypothetical protein
VQCGKRVGGGATSPPPAAAVAAKVEESKEKSSGGGPACTSCKAALKPGMTFCIRCGEKIGSSKKSNNTQQKERRKKAARDVEAKMAEERRKMEQESKAKIENIEKRRRKRRNACSKCKAGLKEGASFCVKCGTKQKPRSTSLSRGSSSTSDDVMSVFDSEMKQMDEEIARIKAETVSKLQQKEEEFIKMLIAQDSKLTEIEDEDFAEQLVSLESKTQDTESEFLEAIRIMNDGKDVDVSDVTLLETKPTVAAGTSAKVVTVKDFDPAKYGLKSFDNMFDGLSDEEDEDANDNDNRRDAKQVISLGAELKTQLQQNRQKREEEENKYGNTLLDDLDTELANLLNCDDDNLELDDTDFDAVGGKYVAKEYIDSDDESTSSSE